MTVPTRRFKNRRKVVSFLPEHTVVRGVGAGQDGPWGRRRSRGPRAAARGQVRRRLAPVTDWRGPLRRYPFPVLFSSCSRKDLEASLQKGVGVCLFNLPDVRPSSGGRKCGNGYVEEGEQCDCGEPEVRTSASRPARATKRERGWPGARPAWPPRASLAGQGGPLEFQRSHRIRCTAGLRRERTSFMEGCGVLTRWGRERWEALSLRPAGGEAGAAGFRRRMRSVPFSL